MEKHLFTKLSSITSTLFDSFVGMYQVCDRDESDDYFKHYLILIFKDRKPHTIYGIKDKDMSALLDEVAFLQRYFTEDKGGNQ